MGRPREASFRRGEPTRRRTARNVLASSTPPDISPDGVVDGRSRGLLWRNRGTAAGWRAAGGAADRKATFGTAAAERPIADRRAPIRSRGPDETRRPEAASQPEPSRGPDETGRLGAARQPEPSVRPTLASPRCPPNLIVGWRCGALAVPCGLVVENLIAGRPCGALAVPYRLAEENLIAGRPCGALAVPCGLAEENLIAGGPCGALAVPDGRAEENLIAGRPCGALAVPYRLAEENLIAGRPCGALAVPDGRAEENLIAGRPCGALAVPDRLAEENLIAGRPCGALAVPDGRAAEPPASPPRGRNRLLPASMPGWRPAWPGCRASPDAEPGTPFAGRSRAPGRAGARVPWCPRGAPPTQPSPVLAAAARRRGCSGRGLRSAARRARTVSASV